MKCCCRGFRFRKGHKKSVEQHLFFHMRPWTCHAIRIDYASRLEVILILHAANDIAGRILQISVQITSFLGCVYKTVQVSCAEIGANALYMSFTSQLYDRMERTASPSAKLQIIFRFQNFSAIFLQKPQPLLIC